ncbi:MAG: PocR ligand-binding domain-containing protein [Desulfobacteraceae bacterium]|nr:PocR ligand-binding domain-containing protein [Desulfobacteraceae bacterium]
MKELFSEIDMMDDGEKTIEDVELLDLFDITELKRINESFADACGVASTLVDKTGEPIIPPANHSRVCTIIRSTPPGRERCRRSARIRGRRISSRDA